MTAWSYSNKHIYSSILMESQRLGSSFKIDQKTTSEWLFTQKRFFFYQNKRLTEYCFPNTLRPQ